MTTLWSQLASLSPQTPPFECSLHLIEDQQVLSIEGPDSQKFMQGQFTCNLTDINTEQFRLGACCTAKGRMVASFNLIQKADGQYLLGLQADVADLLITHLNKYKVFFKTQMQVSNSLTLGVQGPDAQAMLETVFTQVPKSDFGQTHEHDIILIKLPHGAGFQLYLDPNNALATLETLARQCLFSTLDSWHKNLIETGIAHVSAATSLAFIPQMTHLHHNGGVCFSKGCYTGQEIVARMQYLGKLKRHLYRLAFTQQSTLNPGDELFVSGQQSPVGMVVSSVLLAGQQQALVVLEDKALTHINQPTEQGGLVAGKDNMLATAQLPLPDHTSSNDKS